MELRLHPLVKIEPASEPGLVTVHRGLARCTVDRSWAAWLLSLVAPVAREVAIASFARQNGADLDEAADVVAELVSERILVGAHERFDWESMERSESLRLHLAATESVFESSEEAPANQAALVAGYALRDGGALQPGPFVERTTTMALPVTASERPFRDALALPDANETATLALDVLGALLSHAARCFQLRDDPRWGPYMLRAPASMGARHAVELYLVIRDVEGLAPGVYAYQPHPHALARLETDAEPRPRTDEPRVRIVLSMRWPRYQWRYRDHASYFEWAHLEIGHMLSAIELAALDQRLTPKIVHESSFRAPDPLTESAMVEVELG